MAYTIEEEQEINAIKTWWKENYKSLILMVVISISAVVGWRYWQQYQLNQMQQMSVQYDQIIYGSQGAENQNSQIDQFVQQNANTGYATLALFEQAKMAIDKQDFALAETTLKQAVSNAPDETLSSLAALRLATVQLQLQQYDVALTTLNQVKDPVWAERKALLTGDIQLAKGDKEGAKVSYQTAQQSASPLEQQWLQLRLNNL